MQMLKVFMNPLIEMCLFGRKSKNRFLINLFIFNLFFVSFPLKHENEMKDCVYLDWNKRDQIVVYEIDDCRNRRPFLCKKRRGNI